MSEWLPDAREMLRFGTTTVGVITSIGRFGVNLMSAEWTYMVAREPVHFAIGCQTKNHSTRLIIERGEFGLTLCDAAMAPLALFAGRFSGLDTDKSRVSGVRLRPPSATSVPTVEGGSLNAECRVVSVVDLPKYAMVIGEALWLRVDPTANEDPLVKHGGMHTLGPPIATGQVVAATTALSERDIRVTAIAQGPPTPEARWTVTSADGALLHKSVGDDRLDTVVRLPDGPLTGDHLVVARSDCPPVTVALV